MKIEIKNRYTQEVIFAYECKDNSIKVTVEIAVCQNVELKNANLVGANLVGAYLKDSIFEGSNLEGAILEGAILDNANFRGANLKYADLKYTVLEYANFEGSNLEGADLNTANLIGSNLTLSNLENANLEGADLREALFIDTKLKGAILKGAQFKNTLNTNEMNIKTDLTISDINTLEDLLQFFQDALAECKSYHFFDIEDSFFCIGRCFEYRNNKGETCSVFKDKEICLFFDHGGFSVCHKIYPQYNAKIPLWKIADNFKKIGLPYFETLFTLIN